MGLSCTAGNWVSMFTRYAIFYTAPPGKLSDFGASWLGWDSRAGTSTPHPKFPDLDVTRLTTVPRKYGFHGTLKAPFRLAATETEQDIKDVLGEFAGTQAPIAIDSLSLSEKHGFLALRPTGETGDLQNFAKRIVTDFDRFRMPATKAELARRRKAGLTARQDHNLLTWGYPYVMEDFQFHMTLSGPLDDVIDAAALTSLGAGLKPLLPKPFIIDGLALMGQTEDGMFHEIERALLKGT